MGKLFEDSAAVVPDPQAVLRGAKPECGEHLHQWMAGVKWREPVYQSVNHASL